jgi:hypothetical protein
MLYKIFDETNTGNKATGDIQHIFRPAAKFFHNDDVTCVDSTVPRYEVRSKSNATRFILALRSFGEVG